MSTSETIDQRTFQKFCELIYDKAGIKLGPQKEALVSARVSKRMRSLEICDFDEYYQYVERDETGGELVELLNAISTNVTHFFRESRHFELLGPMVQCWEAQGQNRFRIWCAASSTGEEPYSIAITLRESLEDLRDVKILATDLSTNVLAVAREGIYEQKHIENLPKGVIAKHFTAQRHSSMEKVYCVHDELKRMITFARLNLAHPPFPMSGPFDVIFCRNVVIYFDKQTQRTLFDRFAEILAPDGWLFIGHSESLFRVTERFRLVGRTIHRRTR